ncbi:MAG: hypothetical protein ACR5K2_01390 [Wolbachia sp.]
MDKNYHSFAKEVFKGMFEYAEAAVPSDQILGEIITDCNQVFLLCWRTGNKRFAPAFFFS